jgi:hypothetical protein
MRGLSILRISILLAVIFISSCYLIQIRGYHSNAPSSYFWANLRTDTVEISYSFDKSIWYGGTGYLHVKADGPGVYGDTKTTTAKVTISEGSQAAVYVCGDDRYSVPSGWLVEEKYLRLYIDGNKVYELGKEYWWAHCYSKAATLGPGAHEVKLTIHISVKVSANYGERDIAYANMDIKIEGDGAIQANTHTAEAILDGSVNHFFTFRLPEVGGVGNINWKTKWSGVEKTGSGASGSTQTVSFIGVNRDSWGFTSPVLIRVEGNVPSVEPKDGYSINAIYDEGSQSVGIRRVAVAVSNGDEVGFSSGEYLVTSIEYLGLDIAGCTSVDGLNAWANSGSNVNWAQKIRFYSSGGWIVEEAAKGVETGLCVKKKIGGGIFSRKVSFSSRNRVDELTLTIEVPEATLHFDSMRAEPVGPTDLGLRRLGETVELKVKTLDCLGEYSRVDTYSVSESTPGVKSYVFAPLTGVYKDITSTTGGNVTFTIRWSSYKLVVKDVSGGILRNGKYWAKSGSKIEIAVLVYYSDDGNPASGVRIRDSDGGVVLTGSDGVAKFSYVKNNCEARLTYVAVDEHGNRLSDEASVTIVFTGIRLEVLNVDGLLFEGSYYSCNDAIATIAVKVVYTNSLTPVPGALVEFKPSGSSILTGSDGVALLRLTGRDRAYMGEVEASDGFLDGSVHLRIVFTSVLLEPSRKTFSGVPGEEVEVTVQARLTFNDMLLNGVKVRWVEGNIVRETPALFRLKIPEKGFSKAYFEAAGFLPCTEPCLVTLFSNGVKFGEPNATNPTVILNGFPECNYSYRIMLNIMDLLNITIPRVVWYGNGSIAYGVTIGVVSSNGTVVRSSIVSSNGVSFNWTESKPGVYHYFVKPLNANIGGDVLSIEAVFTAFNITANYILDFNDTRLFSATAYWAHNGSPVADLPVHTDLSKQRVISDEDGRIALPLKDSDYNGSCVERILVLKQDAHPSGIWRTIGDCSIRIVKLEWRSLIFTGDQYGFNTLLSLESAEDKANISFRVSVEGYSPGISSSIRILRIKSDNSTMTVFIKPFNNVSFREMFALRMEKVEYSGDRISIGIRSLTSNLTIRNVKIKVANSTFEKYVGDLGPGSYLETVLELPEELRTNPVVLIACSENTVPHAVRIWKKPGLNILAFISVTPFLLALALRLRNRNNNSSQSKNEKEKTKNNLT